MAERRMFAKTIIDSDAFLDMPLSTQSLYFHLSMRADDDGFVNNPKKIQRMIGASDDDLKVLLAKHFLIPFETGIVVIKHWRIHNYIQKDRYKETTYQEEKAMLEIKENNAYTLKDETPLLEPALELSAEEKRKKAYEESELPYSFDYKIRNAFTGHKCPICGVTMSHNNNLVKPTIQHNIPISKGGKHELGNISVICKSCNTSIRDSETSALNAQEVTEVWDALCQKDHVSKMDTQDRIEIGKSKDRLNIFTPPTVEEVRAYCEERHNNIDPEAFIDHYQANGWLVGKAKMKDWKAAVRNWERNRKVKEKDIPLNSGGGYRTV